MLHIEGADAATCDVTMGELISPESDGDYGGMKDSDLIVFYMGKLEKLDAGRDRCTYSILTPDQTDKQI